MKKRRCVKDLEDQMAEKVLISQEIIIFKESDRKKWYQELNKEKPFETDSN
jgi:hypothetical protein